MNFNFVHEFDIDVAGYWKIFLANDFNDALYRELKMKKHEVVKQTDDGKTFHRVQTFEPSTPIPGFLQSIVKDTGYTEIDNLDWATNAMDVVIETQMFKDRFDMRGVYTVSPLAADTSSSGCPSSVTSPIPVYSVGLTSPGPPSMLSWKM